MEDLKILTESVCCIAREAGYFLKEEWKNFSREAVQKKQAHDYVSYVDKESERRVVAAASGASSRGWIYSRGRFCCLSR